MAFNWQTFRTRTLTAAVFVVVMLAGLLWNQWSFLILFSIIHFGCWWEYFKLIEKIHKTFFHPYVKVGLMTTGYALMLWFCGPDYEINGYGLKQNLSLTVSVAGFVVLLFGIFQKNPIQLKAFGAAALGLLYISLSWGMMMDIRCTKILLVDVYSYDNWLYPIVIIASIWINDTMAYLVGSLIGKHPLSKISPKKTWEGTVGGMLLAIIVVGLLFSNLRTEVVVPGNETWYIIAAIAAVVGTLGDLLESKLKRMANVKDSGHIMPGHGGFLDRFDSLLLATPAVWLYINFL